MTPDARNIFSLDAIHSRLSLFHLNDPRINIICEVTFKPLFYVSYHLRMVCMFVLFHFRIVERGRLDLNITNKYLTNYLLDQVSEML